MRLLTMLLLLLPLISVLPGCSHFSGNVVPRTGLTMEQVYDSVIQKKSTPQNKQGVPVYTTARLCPFYKLSNPELKMYVFPHLAGKDQLPIPGYYTVFNAYTQDHYALQREHVC
jgi:hypothetical protein